MISCTGVNHREAFLQPLPLKALPSPALGDQLGGPLTNAKHGQHRVDGGHLGEDTSICDSQSLQSSDVELRIHDGQRVFGHVTHLGGTSGMVHGMCDASTILGEFFVRLDLGSGSDLTLEPGLERLLLSDLASGLETGNNCGGVVAFGVGKVAEVERGLDRRVGGGEVDTSLGAGAGNVWSHAKGIDRSIVAKSIEERISVSFGKEVAEDEITDLAVFRQNGIW